MTTSHPMGLCHSVVRVYIHVRRHLKFQNAALKFQNAAEPASIVTYINLTSHMNYTWRTFVTDAPQVSGYRQTSYLW